MPPGFETRIIQPTTPQQFLNPVGVYILSLAYLHAYQLMQWTDPVVAGGQFGYDGPWTSGILIYEKPPSGADAFVTNGNAMLALYAAVVHMHANVFAPLDVAMTVYGRDAGHLVFIKDQVSDSGGASNNETRDVILDLQNSSSNADDDDEGEIIDPGNPNLVINYRFDGSRVGSTDTFTAIMESIIIMTYYARREPFVSLTAISASGNTALHVNALGHEPPQLNHIGRLIFLLAVRITRLSGFDEMDFSLDYGPPRSRKRVAEGYLLRYGNGVSTGAASTSVAKL
ncbi:MAG: hypothetical protein Q9210_004455 [Variospora velana]